MKVTEETLQRNFQEIEFRDMYLDAIAGSDPDVGNHLDGQRDDFVENAMDLDRISVTRQSDVPERRVSNFLIQKVREIPDVRADHACFDVQNKRIRLIKRGIDVP